jgi:hypothetical protein
MRWLFCILILTSVAALAIRQQAGGCDCPIFQLYGGWCETCNVGYVAGLKIPSKMMFETLHNHGHDVDLRHLECKSCRSALHTGGFCHLCRIGYVEGQGYFSMLAYQLARGKAKRLEQITCETCRANASSGAKPRGTDTESTPWCDKCKLGMLGNVAIYDRAGFDSALPDFRRLLLGLAHLDKCENCAIAIAFNGMCPDCRIEYHEGKGTPLPGPVWVP